MAGGSCVAGACVAGKTAIAAGGTHPTGMDSCLRLDSAELVVSNYERLGVSAEGGLFDEEEDDGGHCDGELNDQIHVSIFIYYNLCLFRLFSSYIIISIFLRKFCISMNMVKFFI